MGDYVTIAIGEYYSIMTPKLPPSRSAEQFVVRFPEGMRDQIADMAKKNSRSMNAEIVHRLHISLMADDFDTLEKAGTRITEGEPSPPTPSAQDLAAALENFKTTTETIAERISAALLQYEQVSRDNEALHHAINKPDKPNVKRVIRTRGTPHG